MLCLGLAGGGRGSVCGQLSTEHQAEKKKEKKEGGKGPTIVDAYVFICTEPKRWPETERS